MDSCPECGNSDLSVWLLDGLPVHECGLCGARSGDPVVVQRLVDADEAKQRGFASEVYPLVRALERLPGLAVRDASAGDLAAQSLPYIELQAAGPGALLQLENLAKSLQLAAGALRRHWVIEVEFRRHLAFMLKPQHGGGPIRSAHVEDAQTDLAELRLQLERLCKLDFWQRS